MERAVQIFMLVFAAGTLAAGVWFIYLDKVTGGSIVCVLGLMLFVFAFLSRFKRFKGLGIEAELWEEKQEEADKLIKKLQALSVIVCRPVMQIGSRVGRLSGHLSRRERHALYEELRGLLEQSGVVELDVAKALEEHHRFTVWELLRSAHAKAGQVLRPGEQSLQQQVSAFGSSIAAEQHAAYSAAISLRNEASNYLGSLRTMVETISVANYAASLDRMERWIDSKPDLEVWRHVKLASSLQEEMEDLRYYIEKRTHRRYDVWISGDREDES